jgi:hypothetical protein
LYAIIVPEAITTMITLNAWIWSRRTNLRAVNKCNKKKIYPTIQHGFAKGTTNDCSSSWCWTKCPYASVRSAINQNKIPNVRYNNDWPCAPRKPYRYIVTRPYIVAGKLWRWERQPLLNNVDSEIAIQNLSPKY